MTCERADRSPIVAALVGVPYLACGRTFAGADCWGIVRLAALRLWDLALPEYFYSSEDILGHARDLIAQETSGPRWRMVDEARTPGAVHIFRIRGAKTHCGLHLGGALFLHSLPGRNSCVETLEDWRARLVGSYCFA